MDVRRNIYLNMKTLAEARDIVMGHFHLTGAAGVETIRVPDAVGRVLTEPIAARLSSPHFHAAAMDGYAVKAETTFGASEQKPMRLRIGGDLHPVNTGHPMPEGTDAVIMIEHVHPAGSDQLAIEAPVYPWQNVRKAGEDIVATEMLFPRNHKITPYCIGALLTGGVFDVTVYRRPKVTIIPTGSELVDWRGLDLEQLKPGQVLESNSYVLGALIEADGGVFARHGQVRDDLEEIRRAVTDSLRGGKSQIVLIAGGSSAGSEDYTRKVMEDLGTVLIHGVTMMPGKPVAVGEIQGVPVVGVPGYAVSSIIAYEQLVRPLLLGMVGQPEPAPTTVMVEITRKIPSRLGQEEFVRVKLGQVGDRIVANPLPRGAGSITSLTKADGILRIPNHVEGITEKAMVPVELLCPPEAMRNTIVIVGSHDNTLDVLADLIRLENGRVKISSSHVGSMGGLMAIKRGAAHLAGIHLLDTADGTYNTSYITKHLPGLPVRRMHLIMRDQGLIVPRGNPKNIRSVEDLRREDVVFINRQGGSGTRILLDFKLSQAGVDPTRVRGYGNEEFTHMSVAVAVLSGAADTGLGIRAAAKALDMDFVPIVTEQYDLVIPETFFDLPHVQLLMETARTDRFKHQVNAMGGYHTERTGEILDA